MLVECWVKICYLRFPSSFKLGEHSRQTVFLSDKQLLGHLLLSYPAELLNDSVLTLVTCQLKPSSVDLVEPDQLSFSTLDMERRCSTAAPKSASALSNLCAASLFGHSLGSQLQLRLRRRPMAENKFQEEDFDVEDLHEEQLQNKPWSCSQEVPAGSHNHFQSKRETRVKEEYHTQKVKSEPGTWKSPLQTKKKKRKGFQPENRFGALGAAKRTKGCTFDLRSKLISKEARAWYLDLMEQVNHVRLALMTGSAPPKLRIPDFPSCKKTHASISVGSPSAARVKKGESA